MQRALAEAPALQAPAARCAMATILDLTKRRPGARHPEKQKRAETPLLAKSTDSRQGADIGGLRRNQGDRPSRNLHTVCEEAACPNIGVVPGRKARDHDDHGRHLHEGVRVLQCEDRIASGA